MKTVFGRASQALVFASLLTGGWTLAGPRESSQQPSANDSQQPPADNTKVNERDRKESEPTADDQKNNSSDLEITKQIRQLVMKDKSLSTYAHNIKIIAQDGMVTLKGPVRSDAEKRSVEAKAAEVVGADKVTSELAIKPKK